MANLSSNQRSVIFGLLATVGSVFSGAVPKANANDPAPAVLAKPDHSTTVFDKALAKVLASEGGLNTHQADTQNRNGSVTFAGLIGRKSYNPPPHNKP